MKSYKKAFTLLEGMVTLIIAGIISAMAIPGIMSQLKAFQLKEDLFKVEQAIKEARSTAITKSSTYIIDFSQATTNNGDDGGLIEVKKSDGTVVSQTKLSKNILYNQSASSISSNQIRFDFRGQPVDSIGSVSGFTEANNNVTISYYKGSSANLSRSIKINPVTGYTKIQ